MDDAMLVHGVEGVAHLQNKVDGAIDGEGALLIEDGAEQAAFDPLDDHVEAGALLVVEGFDDAGVVEFLADLLLAAEALEEDGVCFEFGVGDFDGDGAAGEHVSGLVKGGHAAARNRGLEQVMVQRVASFQSCHQCNQHNNLSVPRKS